MYKKLYSIQCILTSKFYNYYYFIIIIIIIINYYYLLFIISISINSNAIIITIIKY